MTETKFAHFEHQGKFLMNSKLPKALIFGIKIQDFPCTLTSLKLQQILKPENTNFRWNASDSHISKVEPFLENDRIMCIRFLLSSLNLSEETWTKILHKYFKQQKPILVQCYPILKKKCQTIDTHYCPVDCHFYYNIHVPPL